MCLGQAENWKTGMLFACFGDRNSLSYVGQTMICQGKMVLNEKMAGLKAGSVFLKKFPAFSDLTVDDAGVMISMVHSSRRVCV